MIMNETEQAEADAELKAGLTVGFKKLFQAINDSVAADIAKAIESVREELDGLRGEVHELVERFEESQQ